MTRASFWRRLPAAALRGFANRRSPASPWRRFSSSNEASGMNTSPRTSSSAGTAFVPFMRFGIAAIVRDVRGDVLAGDAVAAGRAARRTGRPRRAARSRGRRASARRRSGSGRARAGVIRSHHATSSSRANALSSESIGTVVLTGANVDDGRAARALRRRVGRDELGVRGLERRAARAPARRTRRRRPRVVEHVVAIVGVLDERAQVRDAPHDVLLAALLTGHHTESTGPL